MALQPQWQPSSAPVPWAATQVGLTVARPPVWTCIRRLSLSVEGPGHAVVPQPSCSRLSQEGGSKKQSCR